MIVTQAEGIAVPVRRAATMSQPATLRKAVALRPLIPAALPARSLLLEGEDALLNGNTRSLQRRLFGLNMPQNNVQADKEATSDKEALGHAA